MAWFRQIDAGRGLALCGGDQDPLYLRSTLAFLLARALDPEGLRFLKGYPERRRGGTWGEVEDCNALCSWGELR